MCSSLRIIIVVRIYYSHYDVFESSTNIVFNFVFIQKHDQTAMHTKLQLLTNDQASLTLQKAANAVSVIQLCTR